ncbi:MAG: 50S ribosomal protein L18 [Acidimicrobiia bacterium]|nr:50S ribosomal protein L18 [Acidimicrobiia bacterium]
MKSPRENRITRHRRVRKHVWGSAAKPRLAVFRSNRHVYAQVIDDGAGATIASASTLDPALKGSANTTATAASVGRLVAQRAKEKGVSTVVFDRGGFLYHGKIQALADGAREEGLNF